MQKAVLAAMRLDLVRDHETRRDAKGWRKRGITITTSYIGVRSRNIGASSTANAFTTVDTRNAIDASATCARH